LERHGRIEPAPYARELEHDIATLLSGEMFGFAYKLYCALPEHDSTV
jgi:hypothetical protein